MIAASIAASDKWAATEKMPSIPSLTTVAVLFTGNGLAVISLRQKTVEKEPGKMAC